MLKKSTYRKLPGTDVVHCLKADLDEEELQNAALRGNVQVQVRTKDGHEERSCKYIMKNWKKKDGTGWDPKTCSDMPASPSSPSMNFAAGLTA